MIRLANAAGGIEVRADYPAPSTRSRDCTHRLGQPLRSSGAPQQPGAVLGLAPQGRGGLGGGGYRRAAAAR